MVENTTNNKNKNTRSLFFPVDSASKTFGSRKGCT